MTFRYGDRVKLVECANEPEAYPKALVAKVLSVAHGCEPRDDRVTLEYETAEGRQEGELPAWRLALIERPVPAASIPQGDLFAEEAINA